MDLRPIEGPPVEWKGGSDNTETTRLAQDQRDPRGLREMSGEDLFEKIVGNNNLRAVAYLEKGVQVSRAVAHIELPGAGSATGFLVDDNVLMTNHHVFTQPGEAKDAIVRFNFQKDIQGAELPTDDYRCDPDSLFWTSPENELDCTVVRLIGSPGSRWGVIPMPDQGRLREKDRVVIIQHPAGRHKEIALVDNEVAYVDDRVAQYLTDTEPGSSGSPVFNEDWQLVALHHSGGWIPEPNDRSTHFRNEGIRISAIRAALPSWR